MTGNRLQRSVSADDATREAFDDAIAALETDGGNDDGTDTDT